MICRLRSLGLAIVLLMAVPGFAEEAPGASVQHTIPYKADTASLEDQGLRTALVLLLVLGAAAGALAYLRRRMPQIGGAFPGSSRLKVVERVRLNQTSTMYLVRLDQTEVLFVQSGDSIAQLEMGCTRRETKGMEGDGRV